MAAIEPGRRLQAVVQRLGQRGQAIAKPERIVQ
jgi:hypothetical protein